MSKSRTNDQNELKGESKINESSKAIKLADGKLESERFKPLNCCERNEIDHFMDYDQTAALTGIKKGTLYQLVSQSRMPHLRIGPRFVRFSKKAITDWLNSHEIPFSDYEQNRPAPNPRTRRR